MLVWCLWVKVHVKGKSSGILQPLYYWWKMTELLFDEGFLDGAKWVWFLQKTITTDYAMCILAENQFMRVNELIQYT